VFPWQLTNLTVAFVHLFLITLRNHLLFLFSINFTLNYRFEHISFLFGLALLPFLVVVFMMLLQWKKKTSKKIGDPKLVKELVKNYSPVKFTLKFVLGLLALSFIITGAANLQKPGKSDNLNRKGVDVMIALDVSNSMLAEDVKPNRLERAKQLVNKLMDKMPNDRIGLVLFAGRAYMQMPLTNDHIAAKMYVQSAGPEVVPTQGTVIAEALRVATAGFNSKERKYKSIVLISDGEDHDPEAIKLAQSLSQMGVMINTVGVGSPNGISLIDPGTRETRKDTQGNTVITKLNEDELRQLANNTKGVYTLLLDPNDAVKIITDQLATVEQTVSGDKSLVNYSSYFMWFLGVALLFVLIEFFIPERKIKIA
jgi:Ca-activated chloride channel homolog